MVFPHDFGFVPGTKAEDGDLPDVLILTDEPLFPGRVVGVPPGRRGRNNAERSPGGGAGFASLSKMRELAGVNPIVLGQT